MPNFIIIGGANGAGKSTIFPGIQSSNRTELLFEPGVIKKENFINADIIAKENNLNDVSSARRTLSRLDELIEKGEDLAMESTLSGRTLLKYIHKAIDNDYKIYLIYIYISSYELSATRVTQRALLGKHYIPLKRVMQRYNRSLMNYQKNYQPLAYFWVTVDNSELVPKVMGWGGQLYQDDLIRTESNHEPMLPYISKIGELGIDVNTFNYINDDQFSPVVFDEIKNEVELEIKKRPKGNYVVIEKNGEIVFTKDF